VHKYFISIAEEVILPGSLRAQPDRVVNLKEDAPMAKKRKLAAAKSVKARKSPRIAVNHNELLIRWSS
jgi:hypothetical protein